MKHGLEGVDLYNPIKDKLPQIIEYFVKFYGEEYRKEITEKLSNTIFVFTDRVYENQFTPIEEYFYLNKRKLIDDFQKALKNKFGMDMVFAVDNLEDCMIRLSKFKDEINYKNILLAHDFFLHVKGKKFKLVSPQKMEECLADEKKSAELYCILNGIHDLYYNKYKDDFEYLDNEYKRLQRFNDEDFTLFLKKIDRRFYQKSENLILSQLFTKLSIPVNDENINRLAFYVPMIIDYLEVEGQDLPDYSESLFNNIFREIASLGQIPQKTAGKVDNSDDYAIRYVRKTLDKIKKQVILFRDEEFFGILSARAGIFDNINDIYANFVLGPDCVNAIQEFMLARHPMQGGFNVATVAYDKPKLTRSICVNYSYLSLDDESVIHEMNHAILSNASFDGKYFFNKTGLREQKALVSKNRSGKSVYSSFEKYGAIDETINEYLSQKVVGLMRQDNFKIGYHRDVEVLYRGAFPLLQDFLEENLDTLIKCCASKKAKDLNLIFGEGNFDELADITTECFKLLKDKKAFTIISKDLQNNMFEGESFYDLIHVQGIEWHKETDSYLDCYRRAEVVMGKIEAYKADKKSYKKMLADQFSIEEEAEDE